MLPMMIGSNLQAARKAAGLSLRELAERIENVVSRQALHRYEKGECIPDGEMLNRLSKALNVTTDYLTRESRPIEITFGAIHFHTYGNSRYWPI